MTFLDPACGSGNFLAETYLSLRKLENEALSLQWQGQIALGDTSITPMKETEEILHMNLDFLPLKSYANLIEANALRIEETAQAILDARALYPNSSLADLYDELTMLP